MVGVHHGDLARGAAARRPQPRHAARGAAPRRHAGRPALPADPLRHPARRRGDVAARGRRARSSGRSRSTLDELQARPSSGRCAVTLECAGNGRALLDAAADQPAVAGEAVGTAEWTGTPLAPLLEEAGVAPSAVEVVFTGLDRGVQGGVEHDYARSLPLADALRDEVLLAYEINGQPLPPQHGFPLRLVVPGWYGMTHVKWLRSITVVDEPFDGWQQQVAYHLRSSEDEPGTPVTRMLPALADGPARASRTSSRATRFVDAGPVPARGPRLVGPGADRARRGERRRRRDVGGRAARRAARATTPGAAGATSGSATPASTSCAAARPTRPGTRSRSSPSGTSTASATTWSSACASSCRRPEPPTWKARERSTLERPT